MSKNKNKFPENDTLLLPKRIKRTAKVLILRYRKDKLQFFGLWQQKRGKGIERLVLPGGQIEISYAKDGEVKQEKVIEAAMRETLEEIAVSELNLKIYLGAYSREMGLKTDHKHTYLFLGRIKGKPEVKETDKFNTSKSRFYSFETLDKHAHAPHLHWVYKQYQQGKLEKSIVRFIK